MIYPAAFLTVVTEWRLGELQSQSTRLGKEKISVTAVANRSMIPWSSTPQPSHYTDCNISLYYISFYQRRI